MLQSPGKMSRQEWSYLQVFPRAFLFYPVKSDKAVFHLSLPAAFCLENVWNIRLPADQIPSQITCIPFKIFSGVIGNSFTHTPVALYTACAIAGAGVLITISPIDFARKVRSARNCSQFHADFIKVKTGRNLVLHKGV